MSATIRRAEIGDEFGIHSVAAANTITKEEAAAADPEELGDLGFLFRPLDDGEDEHPGEPTYEEHIRMSDHFWVATMDGEIVAFMMAYTIAQMMRLQNLTEYDRELRDHFVEEEYDKSDIYIAQAATAPERKNRGLSKQIAAVAFDPSQTGKSQRVWAEASHAPFNNLASRRALEANGFKLHKEVKEPAGDGAYGLYVRELG